MADQPTHRAEIYHLIYSGGGHYQARCSCGWKSGMAISGADAWKVVKQFHPEGRR